MYKQNRNGTIFLNYFLYFFFFFFLLFFSVRAKLPQRRLQHQIFSTGYSSHNKLYIRLDLHAKTSLLFTSLFKKIILHFSAIKGNQVNSFSVSLTWRNDLLNHTIFAYGKAFLLGFENPQKFLCHLNLCIRDSNSRKLS